MKYMHYDYIAESYEDILELQKQYLQKHTSRHVFYRGQANSSWCVEPSILRNANLREYKIIEDAIHNNQINIPIKSLFEYIAKMQHYGFPTRFLDLSTSLDVALYFACSDDMSRNENGRLFMFTYAPRSPSNIQVTVLSELCLLKTEITVDKFSTRLIRKYFDSKLTYTYIDKQELNMTITSFCDHGFVVLPNPQNYVDWALYNPRIQRQCGCFFICGNKMKNPLTNWNRLMTHSGNNIILPEVSSVPDTLCHHDYSYSIIIPNSLKQSIMLTLKKKGVTRNYLFAE